VCLCFRKRAEWEALHVSCRCREKQYQPAQFSTIECSQLPRRVIVACIETVTWFTLLCSPDSRTKQTGREKTRHYQQTFSQHMLVLLEFSMRDRQAWQAHYLFTHVASHVSQTLRISLQHNSLGGCPCPSVLELFMIGFMFPLLKGEGVKEKRRTSIHQCHNHRIVYHAHTSHLQAPTNRHSIVDMIRSPSNSNFGCGITTPTEEEQDRN
jgi:hypothetical protein